MDLSSSDVHVYRIPTTSILRDEEIDRFERDVFELIRDKGAVRLAIDFSNTFHVSSRALGLLVAFRAEMTRLNGRLALFGMNPAIERVIELTRLNTLLHILKDETSARATLAVPLPEAVAPAESRGPVRE